MILGDKLKRLRKGKGLSQKAVSDYCGVSLATYRAYEDNVRLPSRKPGVYDSLAEILGCTADYLRDEDAPAPGAEGKTRKPRKPREPRAEKTAAVRAEVQFGGQTAEVGVLIPA